MELESFVNSLRTFYLERPFRQFDIELARGKVLRVTHPDAMAFSGKRAILITTDGLAHNLDHTSVVRVSSTGEPPPRNGPRIKDDGTGDINN
jgi:hypothetical protein